MVIIKIIIIIIIYYIIIKIIIIKMGKGCLFVIFRLYKSILFFVN